MSTPARGGPPREPLWQLILIAIVVTAVMAWTIWHFREDHPDYAVLVAGWIFGAFTVSILLHLQRMRAAQKAAEREDVE